MTKKFLTGAYGVENQQQTHDLYKEWAKSYDQELADNGYASPRRTAEAMAACSVSLDLPLLDIGCGSGISGECLREMGFTRLVGSDFSAEMLEEAEQKNIYESLHLADFNDPFEFVKEPFPLMTAVGVFSIGHAEPDVLETVIDLMPPQGLFGFSLNDHALEEPKYMQVIQDLVMDKTLRIRWQDYGDHVPGIDLQSLILVIEKLS